MSLQSNPPQSPENWENALGRALKNLPERQAPPVLLASVMAQIHARENVQLAPDRSWWRWPLWLQFASALVFAALLALTFRVGGEFWQVRLVPALQHWAGTAQTVISSLASAAEAVLQVRADTGPMVLRWITVGLSLSLLATYFLCVGVGTFIYRTVRK